MSSSSADEPRKVLILHAYSPLNTGDGLLVELTREMVEIALGQADVTVVASDAAAFASAKVIQWSPINVAPKKELARRLLMLSTIALGASPRIRRLAREADLILAVGGAYLRGGSVVETIKTWGAHFGQLSLAAKYGKKTVYLPQSIGPFRGRPERFLRRRLRQVHRVYARDDRTFRELEELGNVERAPDLAVLSWAVAPLKPAPLSAERPVFVARGLPNPRQYLELLHDVSASQRFDWAIQSTGGDNDDRPITYKYSGSAPQVLAVILSERKPRVIVSTRLHGSLAALMAGYPTVHLSYERKGWSAFADLGLDDFVLSARDATLADIDDRVARITADPDSYWNQTTGHVAQIQSRRSAITKELRATAVRPHDN